MCLHYWSLWAPAVSTAEIQRVAVDSPTQICAHTWHPALLLGGFPCAEWGDAADRTGSRQEWTGGEVCVGAGRAGSGDPCAPARQWLTHSLHRADTRTSPDPADATGSADRTHRAAPSSCEATQGSVRSPRDARPPTEWWMCCEMFSIASLTGDTSLTLRCSRLLELKHKDM